MRVEVHIEARQTVVVDLDDDAVERYGIDAVAEDVASMAFDGDIADWYYDIEPDANTP